MTTAFIPGGFRTQIDQARVSCSSSQSKSRDLRSSRLFASVEHAQSTFRLRDVPVKSTTVPVVQKGANKALDDEYTYWRLRVFFSMFAAYSTFYFTRSSFTFVSPVMKDALGWDLDKVGLITSIFPIMYGVSKFLSGIISDRYSTRVVMGVGLMLTGVLNIIFSTQTSLWIMCMIWAMNGVFQGCGAPASARLLTQWYSKTERGTWWGFWNTSHNVGGFLIPLLAGWASNKYGWRYGMAIPGAIAIVVGAIAIFGLRDTPQDVGLPPIETYHATPAQLSAASHSAPKAISAPITNGATPAEKTAEKAAEKPKRSVLVEHVLSNPKLWLLAISYFFVYFVRQGITYWSHYYLLNGKGVQSASEAAMRVSGFEVGGLIGSLASGWMSDKVFNGRRIPVATLYMVGVAAAITVFWLIPAGMPMLDWLAVWAIGFFIYGPQMLVGLAGAEVTHKSAVSTATGLLGWIAYLGAASSGLPLTKVVKLMGWNAYFIALLSCCAIATLLLIPLWSVQSVHD